MKDLAGQRFGRLVALEDTGRRSRGLVVWRCKCDCGREVEVVGSSLTKGNTRSCGCLRRERALDLAGKRFGKLVAVEPTDSRESGSVVWRCRCDCGNEALATAAVLMGGGKQSCGCGKREEHPGHANARDISGERFGKLVAISPTEKRLRGSVIWRCRCDCGNKCEVALSALTSGHRRSCGCLAGGAGGHSARLDLAGRRFGRLVAVRSTDARKGGSVVWECACDCGNDCLATANALVTGKKRSCGCLRTNLGAPIVAGRRFGKLVAVDRIAGPTAAAESPHEWRCLCDCGRVAHVPARKLVNGSATSCGACSS